jgi:enoyl-CoA hydratase/carnithine racemase
VGDSESVLVERDGRVTVITLNRPERLNALDVEAGALLGRAFEDFENDPEQWVAILTGTGRAFCTGNDLIAMSEDPDSVKSSRPGGHGYGFGGITKRFPLYKPVVAAINGTAVAGGLELALACDILVASSEARLGLLEVRWGLMPTGGGTQRLPRSVPRAWANYMILTGEQITAEQAREIGLITHVVDPEQVLAEARRIADVIASRGPIGVWSAKESMLRGADLPLEQGLVLEDMFGMAVLETEDAVEGPLAFAQKRTPQFKGR